MSNRQKIVVGSIAGALVIHALSTFWPIDLAHAQSRSCPNGWETTTQGVGEGPTGSWEPFAAFTPPNNSPKVVYRRCKL
jgi:hypothetical protein